MSSSPVLPYHAQDVEKPKTNGNEKSLQIQVPSPRPGRTSSRTPLSPPRTGISARTGVSAKSTATEMLNTIMSQLGDERNAFDDEDSSEEGEKDGGSESWKKKFNHFRAHLRHTLHITPFHYTIIGLVIFDLIVVFIDLVLSLLNLSCFTDAEKEQFAEAGVENITEPASCLLHESTALMGGEWFLWALSVFLLSIFVLEIFASLIAFGPRRFLKPLYAIDALVVFASFIMEIYFKFAGNSGAGSSAAALVVLRLWKIVRAIHAIAHSIELKNQSIIHEVQEAKHKIEEEHEESTALLRRDDIMIQYLRSRLPGVTDEELDQYVTREIQQENDLLAKEEAEVRDSEDEKK